MTHTLGYDTQTVVVTGAASGMGEATARLLSELGADVVAIDVEPTSVPVASFLETDLRDPDAVERATQAIEGRVDAVFGCAGLPGPPFSDLDVMLVNFVGNRALVEALVPRMPEGSAVAVVGSVAGMGWERRFSRYEGLIRSDGYETARKWCDEHPELIAGGYYPSKLALNAWVAWRSYSLVRDHGVRINCLNPGPTATPMRPAFDAIHGVEFMDSFPKPMGRESTPEEQAWALAMLNSPRLSYVTGISLPTDGGYSAALQTAQIDAGSVTPPPAPR